MSFLAFLTSKPEYTCHQVMAKSIAGVMAYQDKDFTKAATLFAEYFDMKGFGKFPEPDKDDWGMYLNLMLSLFYSKQYRKCIGTCNTLIRINANGSDAYAISALSHYKLGDRAKAMELWQLAKRKGNQIATIFDAIEDVKMQGFND